jgi:hypothetical protein
LGLDATAATAMDHKRRPLGRSLWIKVAPDQYVGVVQTRRKYADPHFTLPGDRQGSVDYLQPVRTAEAFDLNNTIARLQDSIGSALVHGCTFAGC